MNKLSIEQRARIISCLVEGNSIRSTVRITGTAKNTIIKLLVDLGKACAEYQKNTLTNLPCKRIQVDEMWCFCYAKSRSLNAWLRYKPHLGDIWTWISICEETKLVPAWHVGKRDCADADAFMLDLASKMSGRIQLTSDGFIPYLGAIKDAFKGDIDYGQLQKIYGPRPTKAMYRPVIGIRKRKVIGSPDRSHVSTSFVERNNLTMRMGMRRYTRQSNGFSKKLENLKHAVALHFMHYNFARVHQSIRITPAVKAGVSDHVWDIEEIVSLLN